MSSSRRKPDTPEALKRELTLDLPAIKSDPSEVNPLKKQKTGRDGRLIIFGGHGAAPINIPSTHPDLIRSYDADMDPGICKARTNVRSYGGAPFMEAMIKTHAQEESYEVICEAFHSEREGSNTELALINKLPHLKMPDDTLGPFCWDPTDDLPNFHLENDIRTPQMNPDRHNYESCFQLFECTKGGLKKVKLELMKTNKYQWQENICTIISELGLTENDHFWMFSCTVDQFDEGDLDIVRDGLNDDEAADIVTTIRKFGQNMGEALAKGLEYSNSNEKILGRMTENGPLVLEDGSWPFISHRMKSRFTAPLCLYAMYGFDTINFEHLPTFIKSISSANIALLTRQKTQPTPAGFLLKEIIMPDKCDINQKKIHAKNNCANSRRRKTPKNIRGFFEEPRYKLSKKTPLIILQMIHKLFSGQNAYLNREQLQEFILNQFGRKKYKPKKKKHLRKKKLTEKRKKDKKDKKHKEKRKINKKKKHTKKKKKHNKKDLTKKF